MLQPAMEIYSSNTPSIQQEDKQSKTLSEARLRFNSDSTINSQNIKQTQTTINYDQSFAEIKTGLIEKKTLNSRWQSRFFVLTRFRLIYFADQQRGQLKGCFNLVSLRQFNVKIILNYPEIALNINISHQNIAFTKTILLLQIQDQQKFKEWQIVFRDVLKQISTKNYNYSMYPQLTLNQLLQTNQKFGKINNNFWNHLKISKTELMSYASHLDIIFLRSKSALSSLHRFFMRSYFDHVAVILKDQSQRAYLLQAIHEKGVTISKLENLFESFHEQYEDIGYRKLLTSSNRVLPLQQLQEYVNNLVGKKYELSISKLLIGNQTDYADNSDEQADVPEVNKSQKTYFCSQLIADIYLKFRVLINGKSNNYWPKDFQEVFLPLGAGFYFSPIMKVQIPEHEDIDRSVLDD